jgi:general secretion pathway protein H
MGPKRMVARCGSFRSAVPSGAAGFTLFELLVVLAIMALVIGISAPMFSNSLPAAGLRRATGDLAAALRATRDKAVTTNRSLALVLDTRQRKYRLEDEAEIHQLPAEIGLALITAESERVDEFTGRIRFFPDGSSTGGRITLSQDGRDYSIGVNWMLGRIRIDDH